MQKTLLSLLVALFYSSTACSDEYRVAVRAHHGIDNAVKQWTETIRVLEAAIPGHRFTLLPIIKLDEISRRAGTEDFDFLITNPSSFVEVESLYQGRALATLNNKRSDTAQTRFGSVIFTHATYHDIVELKDLEGKSLMAVSEPAFGGWRVAWLEMLQNGFDPYVDLAELKFSESRTQPEVVYAVRDGKVDAGVVRTDLLERMERAGKIDMRYFRILNSKQTEGFPFFHSTQLYPEWAFVSLKHIPAELSDKIRKTLLMIRPGSDAAIKGKYIGWVEALDYTSVRNLMQDLQVGPYAKAAGEKLPVTSSTDNESPADILIWLILATSVIFLLINFRKTR